LGLSFEQPNKSKNTKYVTATIIKALNVLCAILMDLLLVVDVIVVEAYHSRKGSYERSKC